MQHQPWNKYMKSFLDIDWTKTPYIFILSLSFILSRVPLLNLGFGTDPDAWRIAGSAFDLGNSHIYHTSRYPGYPFIEYVNSLVINHGWLATNGLTLILSLISVIFFAKILKDLNIQNKGLLVLTYAFLPIIWINSAGTMDYMWALTFILAAWFLILKKKFAFAGLILGLAVGSRITSIIFIVPFIYLIWIENKRIKDIIYFIVTMVIISFILFLPLFIQQGLKFLTYYPSDLTMIKTIVKAGSNAIGLIGNLPALFGLIMLILSLKVLFKKIIEKDKDTIFLVLAIISISILFIKAPYEKEYLIPVIPFSLLLLNKICKRELIMIFCLLLLLNSFLSFPIIGKNNGGNIVFNATIDDGMIRKNINERTEQISFTHKLMNASINHSVIIIAWYLPVISYLDPDVSYIKTAKFMGDQNDNNRGNWNFGKDIYYKHVIPPDQLQDFRNKGYSCYYIYGMENYTRTVYNYDLNKYGCKYLNLEAK